MSNLANVEAKPTSGWMRWTGRVISALMGLAMAASAVMKFSGSPDVIKGFAHLGWPDKYATALGIVELVCAIVYLIPQTAVLGAILLTGYLGGAIATHVRLGEPVYLHVLLGVLIWLGIFLRDRRLRSILPWRSVDG
jgi:hypothetical protein